MSGRNLARLLYETASAYPDRLAIQFLKDGAEPGQAPSFQDLWNDSAALAAQLQQRFAPGERVGVLHELPHRFLTGFFACQLAGLVAVPLPATGRKDQRERWSAFMRDAAASAVLVGSRLRTRLASLSEYPSIDIDAPAEMPQHFHAAFDVSSDSLAYLQYTSGSTGNPKGVCIAHGNVLANLRQIVERLQLPHAMSMVSWLPNHHDQGLVGSLLLPVFLAGTCYAMTPAAFVQHPLRWLQAISRYRAWLSGGPNFTFDHCTRAARRTLQRLDLDLSNWRVAFNGAERVSPATLSEFSARFEPYGFSPSAWVPCYGLAEATLAVSMPAPNARLRTIERADVEHVSCGWAMNEDDIAIVDADSGEERAPAQIGEIWVRGPSVAARYWNQQIACGRVANRDASLGAAPDVPYLRTGDFGFLDDGQLFVVGRHEDRLVVRGRNLFATDLEKACRSVADEALFDDCAVFASNLDTAIHMVVEVRRVAVGKFHPESAAERIAHRVHSDCDFALAEIHFVREGLLPRTTSGKIRRAECARLLLSSRIQTLRTCVPGPVGPSTWQPTSDPLLRSLRALFSRLDLADIAAADDQAPMWLDSIDRVSVVAAVEESFGVSIELWTEQFTLSSLAEAIRNGRAPEVEQSTDGDETSEELAELQKDLLFADQICDSSLFTVGCVLRMRETVPLSRIAAALDRVIERYPLLRSAVAERSSGQYRFSRAQAPTLEVATITEEWFARPFDIATGPLMRVGALSDNGTAILIAAHHLVADHWSMQRIARELGDLCYAPAKRLPAAVPYGHFAKEHRRLLETELASLQQFWRDRLRGFVDMPLLTGRQRKHLRAWTVHSTAVDLPASASEALTRCAASCYASVGTVVLALFGLLISRCSRRSQITVACPISLRDRRVLLDTVGYVVNTVPVSFQIAEAKSFRSWCSGVNAEFAATKAHAALPQYLIARELPTTESRDAVPALARYVLNFVDERPARNAQSVAADELYSVLPRASHPLAELQLTVRFQKEGLRVEISALEERYEHAFLVEIRESVAHLLKNISSMVEAPVGVIELLSERQRKRLDSRAGPKLFLPGKRLEEWIDAAAALFPDRVALSGYAEDGLPQQLSYLELRSLKLAGMPTGLRAEPVAVVMKRSIEQILSILAILRAGAVYLPIDPQLPTDRIATMIDDSGARCILADREQLARLSEAGFQATVPIFDHAGPEISLGEVSDGEPAALIYTSGSTGRPKGVMVSHAAYVARLRAMQEELGIDGDDVFLQKTSISFDVSLWEIFLPLVTGARLVLPAAAAAGDPQLVTQLVETQRVTTLHYVPTVLREWLAVADLSQVARTLRRCLCSGEALRAEHRDALTRQLPGCVLVNLYGPTECAVDVTWTTDLGNEGDPSIGKPAANVRIHILDPSQRPLPSGCVGQLCIAGPQVAIGYWKRPELTAQKFVPACDGRPGERMYLSGDSAAWRPDGQIAYHGRGDRQVKLRGVRIELDEIRSLLCAHADVEDAEVLTFEAEGDLVLAAAVISYEQPDIASLREHLAKALPASMIPTIIAAIPQFPVLANGKRDRERLIELLSTSVRAKARPIMPASIVEGDVADAWRAVLGVEPQPGDRFFAVGGDSIKAIRLVAALQARGMTATVAEIYRFQSIEEQMREFAATTQLPVTASYHELSLLPQEVRDRLDLDALEDAYPLSMLQRSIVLHSFGEARYEVYLSGALLRGKFLAPQFEQAVTWVMRTHAFLRSSYDLTHYADPLQLVHAHAMPPIAVTELAELDEIAQQDVLQEWRREELLKPFDWGRPPLLRLHVHLLGPNRFIVHMSEAALDGWCVALVLRDLLRTYDLLLDGRVLDAPAALPSYGRFVALERAAMSSATTRKFWRDRVHSLMPQYTPRWASKLRTSRVHKRMEVRIPADIAAEVHSVARERNLFVKHVYLALYAVLISLLRSREDVLVLIECNGRPEHGDDDRTVGVFNNMLPLQISLAGHTWVSLAERLFALEAEFQPHRRFPVAEILREYGGRLPTDALFVYTDFHVLDTLQGLDHLQVLDLWASDETYVPITFHVNHSAWHGMRILVDYDEAEFCEPQVSWIRYWLMQRVRDLPASMDRVCGSSSVARDTLSRELWRHREGSVVERILLRSAQSPAHVAMIESGRSITYGMLRFEALAYANLYSLAGLRCGDSVALVARSSIDVVCAALGAWWSGVCCVFVDPYQPPNRIRSMLATNGVKMVLTHAEQRASVESLTQLPVRSFAVDSVALGPSPLAAAVLHPEQGAYILHTSGSTGEPKSVLVSHAALANYVRDAVRLYAMSSRDQVWNHSSIGFDFTLTTLIAPLTAGCTIRCVEQHEFASIAEQARATDIVKLTPSHLSILRSLPGQAAMRLPDRTVVGGELLGNEAVQSLLRLNPRARIFNEYGPTETCVGCSVQLCDGEDDDLCAIGSPIDGMQLRVLDSRLLPIAAERTAGEIFIAGIGLACGYLDHPELTAARFLPCPFGPPGSRMYRTGDLGRHVDGRLICLGRVDRQVKVRAHRVELGEVESCLARCAEVTAAAVDFRAGRVVAWLMMSGDVDVLWRHRLGIHIEQHLPEHMWPTCVYAIASLPLTSHGKIDYAQLREQGDPIWPVQADLAEWVRGTGKRRRESSALAADPERVERLHRDLSVIWAEVMQRPVSIDDNFFRLGGSSISSIQITAKARQAGIPLTSRLVLEHPTIAELTDALLAVTHLPAAADSASLHEHTSSGEYSLTPMQLGILHDCLAAPEQGLYQSFLVLDVMGELDRELLSLAWNEVFRANPALRTYFTADAAGSAVQVVDDDVRCPLVILDCDDDQQHAAAMARVRASFTASLSQLREAPLCGLAVLRRSPRQHTLVMTHHHLILDGWSQQLVLEELFATYAAFLDSREPELLRRPSFQRFVQRSRSAVTAASFWRDYFHGYRGARTLTVKATGGATTTECIAISSSTAASLAMLSADAGVTVAAVVQGLWTLTVAAVADRRDIVYGLTVSGRDHREGEIEDWSAVVGMCINTLPVRVTVPERQTFHGWLLDLQRSVASVMEHQHTALSNIAREAGTPAAHLLETLVVVENLPPPIGAAANLQTQVAAFHTKEGLPIVLVVFLGEEPRIELRTQPDRCAPDVPMRLRDALIGLLQMLPSLQVEASLESILHALLPRRSQRSTKSLSAATRMPV